MAVLIHNRLTELLGSDTEMTFLGFYVAAFAGYAAGTGLRLLHFNKAAKVFTWVALTCNGALLVQLTAQSGHVPLFNTFESFVLATFILGLMGLSRPEEGKALPDAITWVQLMILLLLAITLFFPKTPAPDRSSYSNVYVFFFYGFRGIAFPLMFFASAHFFQFLGSAKKAGANRETFHKGRNLLILATVFFLASEYVGIVWCQRGWGDFWMWNFNFLSSTFIVLYLMLAFHIPAKGHAGERVAAVVGGMGSVVMLGMILARSTA